jgi:hypothetical protein
VISGAVITERPLVDLPHGLSVARQFFAKIHVRILKTSLGTSHSVLARPDAGA